MPRRVFICPRCKNPKPYYFNIGFTNDGGMEKFISNHIQRHRNHSTQKDLYMNDVDISTEVKTSMKIEKEILESVGSFIKPGNFQPPLPLGATVTFNIVGDVTKNGALYSVPVKHKSGEGNYSLNRTSLKALATALTDDTANWIGCSFNSMVVPQRNPQTNQQVMSFTILTESIKKK